MVGVKQGARTLPSTLPLERIISLWDFYIDIRDNKTIDADLAPGIQKPKKLPLVFETSEDYIEAYEGLFLLEANNSILRSKEQAMGNTSEKMTLRKYTLPKKIICPNVADDFVRLTLSKTELNDLKYSSADLVLLSADPDPLKVCATHAIAFVEGFAFNELSVRLKIKKNDRCTNVARAIKDSSPWYVAKIDSFSTITREFIALRSFPELILRDHLLLVDNNEAAQMSISDALANTLEKRFNVSQLAAIHSSRKSEGITLIQGPPGTGKTSTVIGILSVLLQCGSCISENKQRPVVAAEKTSGEEKTSRAKRFAMSMPWMFPNYDGCWMENEVYCFDVATDRKFGKPVYIRDTNVKQMWRENDCAIPRKVLVTAPSNGAVDEIIRRLLQDGLISADGSRKTPRLVRCGPNVHEALLPYSLNYLTTIRAKSWSGATDQGRLEKAKQQILDESQIILATNSVAGSRDLQHYTDDFDTVVVDEASQGVELSTLIPLITGCRRLILVGDPKQLPATVFSQAAKECGYDRSLFQRLQESKHAVNMLNEQFRMHPQIAMFPSTMFYEGKLKSHYTMHAFEEKFPSPWSTVPCFSPVTFFHVPGAEHNRDQSYVNDTEANFILQLVSTVKILYDRDMAWIKNIAIISPYQAQVKLIRQKFREDPTKLWTGPDGRVLIDISTIDGFQGREKEVIVMSAVRADRSKGSIGFVRDVRRMNVGFTRPRRNLWVIGHADVLATNSKWEAFLEFVEDKASRINVSYPQNSFLHRWLHDYYKTHPEIMPPVALSEIPQGSYLDEEGILDIYAGQELTASYRIADQRGDFEDDYCDLVEFDPDP